MHFVRTSLASVLDGDHKGSSSGPLYNVLETHDATLPDQQRKEIIKNINKKTEKEIKKVNKKTEKVLYVTTKNGHVGAAHIPSVARRISGMASTIEPAAIMYGVLVVDPANESLVAPTPWTVVPPSWDSASPVKATSTVTVNGEQAAGVAVGLASAVVVASVAPSVVPPITTLAGPIEPPMSDAHATLGHLGMPVVFNDKQYVLIPGDDTASKTRLVGVQTKGTKDKIKTKPKARGTTQSPSGFRMNKLTRVASFFLVYYASNSSGPFTASAASVDLFHEVGDAVGQSRFEADKLGSSIEFGEPEIAVEMDQLLLSKETTKHDVIVLPSVGPFAEEARKKLQGHGSQSLLRGGIATDHQEIIDTVDADITDVGDALMAQTKEASKLRGISNGNNHEIIGNVDVDMSHALPAKTDRVNEQEEIKRNAVISNIIGDIALKSTGSLGDCSFDEAGTDACAQALASEYCSCDKCVVPMYGEVDIKPYCKKSCGDCPPIVLPDWNPNPGSTICGLGSSDIDKYVSPPKEVMDLIKISFGIEWGINPIRKFSTVPASAPTQDVCGDLDSIMASEKPFIVVSAQDPIQGATKVLLDKDAQDQSCRREIRKNGGSSCPDATNAEEIENPLSTVLSMVLPICMGVRFCDDSDRIGHRVQFGFVTHANDGSGIRIASLYGIDIYFQALAFDTKGKLNFAFHEKLINPKGGLLAKPKGAHFLLRGGMGFPLEKRVKGGAKKSLGTFSVTGQFGMYSKVTVGGKETADVFKVIKHLSDPEQLAMNFEAVFFQVFFSAEAILAIDLGVLFGTSFTLNFKATMSAMLEVNVAPGAIDTIHATDLGPEICTTSGKWYLPLDMAGQGRSDGSPIVCQQRCKDTPGCNYFNNFPNGGCHITTGAGGEQSGGSNPTAMSGTSTCSTGPTITTAAECYNDATQANQETYIAFYMSQSRQLSLVLSTVLDPFGKFGEFLTSLIPVKDVSVALRHYVKLPLSGLAHFILQFAVEITINCGIIDVIKKLVKGAENIVGQEIWTKLPGSAELDAFCSKSGKLSATFSIGFEGMNLDRKNSFLEFEASGQTKRIGFDIFPSCPPPVLTGGDCSGNDDCISAAHDPEASSCSGFDGYCKNHHQFKSSVGCSGKCIEKLEDGADCSKSALNIHWADPTKAGESGDDNACKSGQCICGRCGTGFNGSSCSENGDCSSGYCKGWSTIACQGKCHRKAKQNECCKPECAQDFKGYSAAEAANAYCESNRCICGYCANIHGKHERGRICATHDNCLSNNCDEPWYDQIGCKGKCK